MARQPDPSGASDPRSGSMSGSMAPSSQRPGGRERETFATDELAIVLSHYDLGIIDSVQEFPRGSRRSPKLLINTQNASYLLKRRAQGKDDPFKVAFCHSLQLHLASKQFPLPHLIGTKGDNNSMLQLKRGIYEVFEYIKGTPYDSSLEATTDSGRILALFHRLLAEYHPPYEPPKGSYHAARSVIKALEFIPGTLAKMEKPRSDSDPGELDRLLRFVHEAYSQASLQVEQLGFSEWPQQIVHSDWHPGNMLYRGPRVVAVIDYDAARINQRIVDVANGALQFSITGGGDDCSKWPDYLDESRFKRFLRGYDSTYRSTPEQMLSVAEVKAVPWLMIEALIAEAVIPIAATGTFARLEGLSFLRMLERKVRWMQKSAAHLVATLET